MEQFNNGKKEGTGKHLNKRTLEQFNNGKKEGTGKHLNKRTLEQFNNGKKEGTGKHSETNGTVQNNSTNGKKEGTGKRSNKPTLEQFNNGKKEEEEEEEEVRSGDWQCSVLSCCRNEIPLLQFFLINNSINVDLLIFIALYSCIDCATFIFFQWRDTFTRYDFIR